MTRSYRKTPIAAVTSAPSDKGFKAAEHRRERRKIRELDLTEEEVPHQKTFGDPWRGDKDGKLVFDPREDPKRMRK